MQVRDEKTEPLLHYSYDMQNEKLFHGGCTSDQALTRNLQARSDLVFFDRNIVYARRVV